MPIDAIAALVGAIITVCAVVILWSAIIRVAIYMPKIYRELTSIREILTTRELEATQRKPPKTKPKAPAPEQPPVERYPY